MFVLCWNMPVLCGTGLSGKRTQCPWNGYRPVLPVVFSKLTGLHQKRNFSDSSTGQHLDGDGEITSLAMFHKLLHSRPEPLSECLFQYASATSCRSRRKPFQLLLPHTRTTRYRESFFYRPALLWNSLPHNIQSLKNSKSFRNALENHY